MLCERPFGGSDFWRGFRVILSVLFGVPFPVALIDVRRARDPELAIRVAELKLIRRSRLNDWRERADALEVERQRLEPPSNRLVSWLRAASDALYGS